MSNDVIEVSIVTPTYHRRQFIPALIQIYQQQTYPKEKMEWIIVDDSRHSMADLFEEAAKTIPNLRYLRREKKLRIGEKRNLLNDEAQGKIIIAMDDDDYYPPHKVQTVVDLFQKNPNVQLMGSSQMFLYYMKEKEIYSLGPYHKNHATNGTMAWRKSYSNLHRYDEYVTKGEESSFLEKYCHEMIQMNPHDAILVMCHGDNTVDKTTLKQEHDNNPIHSKMKQTAYQLHDFVKEPELYAFYLSYNGSKERCT